MALDYFSTFPGKVDPPNSEYPQGKARNVVTAGDGTGTPWDQALVNDLFGLLQSLLDEASIVPNNLPDKVGGSQYTDALKQVIRNELLNRNDANLEFTRFIDGNNIWWEFWTPNQDANFNRWRFDATGSTFKIQTRNNGAFLISDDYVITKNASGAAEHRFNIANVLKFLINSAGAQIQGDLTVTGDTTLTGNIVSGQGQLAAAWVNFDGNGGAVINDSFNISSVIRNSAGYYTITFANNFLDTNYCVQLTTEESSVNPNTVKTGYVLTTSKTVSSFEVITQGFDGNLFQRSDTIVNITVFAKQ